MSEHGLSEYIDLHDFQQNDRVDASGKTRIGFSCPFCGYTYNPDFSAGSFNQASEEAAVSIKIRSHAIMCDKYKELLSLRKRRKEDPTFSKQAADAYLSMKRKKSP